MNDGILQFMLVVQVDNYLYTGTDRELSLFETFLQGQFKIVSLECDSFPVLGCQLTQHEDKSITITQQARSSCVDTSSLDVSIRKRVMGIV